jgi:hypothetical protein
MKAIDRVIRAYEKTRKLTPEQTELVRNELSKFIDELVLFGPPALPAHELEEHSDDHLLGSSGSRRGKP